MSYCPWNGVACGCGKGFPFTWNERMPARCEQRLPLYMVGAYIRPQRVSDAKMAAYRAWCDAGQPRLGGDEPETDEPDYAQGG